MAYSEAQKNATLKYRKESYARISLDLKKEKKEKYKAQAAAHGMSLNAYIISLLEADGEKRRILKVHIQNPIPLRGSQRRNIPRGPALYFCPNLRRGYSMERNQPYSPPCTQLSVQHPDPTRGGPPQPPSPHTATL